MNDSRRPGRTKRRNPDARYEICKGCGLEWNVAKTAVVDWKGYLCPNCRNRRRKEARFHE